MLARQETLGPAAPYLAAESVMRRLDAQFYDRVLRLPLLPSGSDVSRALVRLQALAPAETLRQWRDELRGAVSEASDVATLRTLVAWVMDCFPRRVAPDAFLEGAAAVLSAERVSPAVLASACLTLIAERKRSPSIADFVAGCRAQRARFERALKTIERAEIVRHNATLIARPALATSHVEEIFQ